MSGILAANSCCTYVGLHPDVAGAVFEDGCLTLHLSGNMKAQVRWTRGQVEPWLRRLCDAGLPLASVLPDAGGAGAREADAALAYLTRARLLVWWYGTADRRLLVADPVSGTFAPGPPADAAADLVLSDLAVVSRSDGRVTVNEPCAEAILEVPAAGLPLLPSILAHGRPSGDDGPALLPDGAVDFLARCGFLRPRGSDGPFAAAWTSWEWWMHRQTRVDGIVRHTNGSANKNRVPKNLPMKRGDRTGLISLPRGVTRSSESSLEAGMALEAVMDARRSIREPSDTPLSAAQLGAVLWSVARYRSDRFPADSGLAVRNLPGAGALGEMEFHVAVNRCDGLERGFYLYDGVDHALAQVAGPSDAFERLLADTALRLFIGGARPDCVVVLSTRQARLSQKYFGGAYRLSLLHTGIIYEALYLAATALGLSPCAAGFGDSDLFARLTGLQPFEETAIGEFALSGPRS